MSRRLPAVLAAAVCVLLLTACSGETGNRFADMSTGSDTAQDLPADTPVPSDTADTNDTPNSDQSGCTPACGANSSCVDATCVCATGFGDCNADPGDGCEASLDQPETCGTCDPGALCDTPNIEAVCQVTSPGTTGACDPTTCATGYRDLDGDTGLETPTNGCESALTVVTASLPGEIEEMVVDGDTLYALIHASTIHVAVIDVSGPLPVVESVFDTGLQPGSTPGIEASNDIVLVHSGVPNTTNNTLTFYQNMAGTLTVITTVASFRDDIVAIRPAVNAGSVAEFIAVGSNTVWFGLYPTGSAPGTLNCVTSDPGVTVTMCGLAVSTSQAGARVGVFGEFTSNPVAVIIGDATTYFVLDDAPAFVGQTVGGGVIGANVVNPVFAADGAIWALDSNELVSFTHMISGGLPTSRSRTTLVNLPEPMTSLARLDDDYAVVGSPNGLFVVAVPPARVTPIAGPASVSELVLDGTTVYAAEGSNLWVLTTGLP